jgi:hypothetical protein
VFVPIGVASIRKDGPLLVRLLIPRARPSANMSVTVGEILVAARARLAALTPETVGYLVLAAADRVCPASPASFEVNDIELDERGSVTVPGIRPAAQDQGEARLRAVLRDLLGIAQSGAPALDRVGRATEQGSGRLIGEIEAALIPVNRSAARRALARLHRDVARVRTSGELAREPSTAIPVSVAAVAPPEPAIALGAPQVLLPEPDVIQDAPEVERGTPVVELPPVEPRLVEVVVAEAVAAPEEWAASAPISGSAPLYQPEATPFLGAWPVAEMPEHDTDHVPSVVLDERVEFVPIDRSDVAETTQVLFATATATAVEMTQPIPVIESQATTEREWDGVARIMGPVWTPVVAADVELIQVAVAEDLIESTEPESEDAWIVSILSVDDPPNVQEAGPVEAGPVEAGPMEAGPVEAGPVEEPAEAKREAELAEPAPEEEFARLAPVENELTVLEPLRHAGWTGWLLTPAGAALEFVDLSEVLLDGESIVAVPPPAEAEVVYAAEVAVDVLEEIDVTYEDVEPADEPVVEVASDSELPSVVQSALLEWVVREDALYEDILGVQDDIGQIGVDDAVSETLEAQGDISELVEAEDDLGEMEWIKAEEKLSQTPCEVPFAKYDPRESYAPSAMLDRWLPEPEMDADAIDAGWEIDSESSLPPVAVSVASRSEEFPEESPTPPPYRPRQSDVSELLAGFVVAESRTLRDLSRELKRIAGVAVTPAPPAASPLAVGGGGVETSSSCTSRTWPSSRDS